MKLEINSKYKIGDVIQLYKEVVVYDEEVICPICNGKYKAPNPNYDYETDEKEFLTCGCCDRGKIKVGSRIEKVVDSEKYMIIGTMVDIDKDGNITYKYRVESNPKLNNREYLYCSRGVKEEEIALNLSI